MGSLYNVPASYKENPSLGAWVSKQRMSYRQQELKQEYIDRLNRIGFEWDPLGAQWETMFSELCSYKQNQAHCNVPASYEENSSLHTWIGEQRKKYKKNQLAQERIDMLNEIGFVWRLKD